MERLNKSKAAFDAAFVEAIRIKVQAEHESHDTPTFDNLIELLAVMADQYEIAYNYAQSTFQEYNAVMCAARKAGYDVDKVRNEDLPF